MTKKQSIGFETPSMHIQEEYKEILEQILAKKADWKKITTSFNEIFDSASNSLQSTLKDFEETKPTSEEAAHFSLTLVSFKGLLVAQSITQVILAKIGKELTECDVRIATVEKELKTLRRGLS